MQLALTSLISQLAMIEEQLQNVASARDLYKEVRLHQLRMHKYQVDLT
jgi:hypothetical protein